MSRVQESLLRMSQKESENMILISVQHSYILCPPCTAVASACRSPLHATSINKDISRQAEVGNSCLWGYCLCNEKDKENSSKYRAVGVTFIYVSHSHSTTHSKNIQALHTYWRFKNSCVTLFPSSGLKYACSTECHKIDTKTFYLYPDNFISWWRIYLINQIITIRLPSNVTLDLQPCELKITCFIINRHNVDIEVNFLGMSKY